MIYPNDHTEIEALGGPSYRAIVHLRPIAYYVGGSPRAITGKLAATGDAAFGLGADELIAVKVASRIQGNASLWEVRDGSRRAWARLALEGANRVEGKAQGDNAWLFPEALPGADLSVNYGGHRVAADFALGKGHPKAFTWRLDAQEGFDPKALTLGDLTLRQPVLLPPQESPWVLPIPLKWEVRSKGGRYTLTCALPDGDWAGWTLDPTLVIQPTASDGLDTILHQKYPTTNYGTNSMLLIGAVGSYDTRTVIQFDLSALPDAPLSSAVLTAIGFYIVHWTGAGDYVGVYRLKSSWQEMQATWTNRLSGTPWASPGAFGTDDCEQTEIASCLFDEMYAGSGIPKSWNLPLSKADMDLGYGWLLKLVQSTGTSVQLRSSDYALPSTPKLTVTWVEGGGPALASGVFRSGVFGHKMVR